MTNKILIAQRLNDAFNVRPTRFVINVYENERGKCCIGCKKKAVSKNHVHLNSTRIFQSIIYEVQGNVDSYFKCRVSYRSTISDTI